jgi:hypothetical protein
MKSDPSAAQKAIRSSFWQRPVDRRAKFRQFWQDLKRREIFRTGVIYSVVAWAIVQVASIAFPAFGVADWAMRALLVAAFAGFPVAIVLAWVFDVTPRGIGVTPPSDEIPASPGRPRRWWLRPLVAAPVMAGIVGATAWLWTSDLSTRGESEFTRQLRPDELPIVAVLPARESHGPQGTRVGRRGSRHPRPRRSRAVAVPRRRLGRQDAAALPKRL